MAGGTDGLLCFVYTCTLLQYVVSFDHRDYCPSLYCTVIYPVSFYLKNNTFNGEKKKYEVERILEKNLSESCLILW